MGLSRGGPQGRSRRRGCDHEVRCEFNLVGGGGCMALVVQEADTSISAEIATILDDCKNDFARIRLVNAKVLFTGRGQSGSKTKFNHLKTSSRLIKTLCSSPKNTPQTSNWSRRRGEGRFPSRIPPRGAGPSPRVRKTSPQTNFSSLPRRWKRRATPAASSDVGWMSISIRNRCTVPCLR